MYRPRGVVARNAICWRDSKSLTIFSRVRESVILLLHAKQGEVNGKEKGLACDIGAPLRRMPNGWHQVKGADEMTSTVNPPQCP